MATEVAEFNQAVSLCKQLIKMQFGSVGLNSYCWFSVHRKEILISYSLLFLTYLYGRRFGDGLLVRKSLILLQ